MKFNFTILVILVFWESKSVYASDTSPEEGKRLIQVSENEAAKWLSQEEIFLLICNKTHFMDVTNRSYPVGRGPSIHTGGVSISFIFYKKLKDFYSQYNSEDFKLKNHLTKSNIQIIFSWLHEIPPIIVKMFSKINIPRMETFVAKFSSYPNRYYKSQSGGDSSEWFYSLVRQEIDNNKYVRDVSVRYFHHSWPQKSVVARIEGIRKNKIVILGSHLDSINMYDPTNGVAPGADDNASGCVTVLEAFRVILASGIAPVNSIEFHWYAAEEAGLLGSQDIAENYYNKTVFMGMMHFDVVGYNVGINKISLAKDHTDPNLNAFIRLVIAEYLNFIWRFSFCGYACSDHASWTKYGFPAAFPAEAKVTPYEHTANDTFDKLNFNQIQQFVKLAVAFVVELVVINL